jgi:hypothetical protein
VDLALVIPITLDSQRPFAPPDGTEIGWLYNKHGDARGKHYQRGDRYHSPSQA